MKNNSRSIFLRADGSSKVGLGHIFRSLALAEIIADKSNTTFISRNLDGSLRKEVSKYCDNLLELTEASYQEEAEAISEILTPDDIIICDGYKFDAAYQLILKKSAARLICIDDIFSYHFYADVVINHAGGITPPFYSYEEYTKLYLGPAYAIVRSEFWNKPSLSEREQDNVLICLGGADPRNDLMHVLENALKRNRSLTYHVVTGSAYQYEAELKHLLQKWPSIQHYKSLDAASMRALMQKCAIAICSPSTVSYEYLSLGGELYLYPIADNQLNIYKYFTRSLLAFPFEDFNKKSRAEIDAMKEKQSLVFDGKSYKRIKQVIING